MQPGLGLSIPEIALAYRGGGAPPSNDELREDGGHELREDGGLELRE